MKLKYKCLVLDHDDTVTQSTPEIHHPSFVEAQRILRPDMEPLSLEEFVSCCFSPGFGELCTGIMKFSEEELKCQNNIWRKYTKTIIPDFYPGFAELIKDYKNMGGIICVVSHSESEQIDRDYRLKCGFSPDLIFGWDQEENKRKPNPYPLLEIMKRFDLEENELLMVDDLKPGMVMARSCDVPFAAAGWSHMVPEIIDYMRENSDFYFETVDSFRKFILG